MQDSARWVDRDEELAKVLAKAGASPRLALDTEADAFHAYRPRLFLVQLAWETSAGIEVALIDTLALAGRLGVLRALLERGDLEKGTDPALAAVLLASMSNYIFLVGPVARRVFLDPGPSLQKLPDAILSLFRKGVSCREA